MAMAGMLVRVMLLKIMGVVLIVCAALMYPLSLIRHRPMTHHDFLVMAVMVLLANCVRESKKGANCRTVHKTARHFFDHLQIF
jgi:hypothetical protein